MAARRTVCRADGLWRQNWRRPCGSDPDSGWICAQKHFEPETKQAAQKKEEDASQVQIHHHFQASKLRQVALQHQPSALPTLNQPNSPAAGICVVPELETEVDRGDVPVRKHGRLLGNSEAGKNGV